MARLIMFAVLAVVILASAVFCVSTKRIMRAATALLFVLFGVAGLYFLLDYTFLAIALAGLGTVTVVLLKNELIRSTVVNGDALSKEISMDVVGQTLMSADKYGYVLPFEFISVFLLACIIGGLVILNNKKKEESK